MAGVRSSNRLTDTAIRNAKCPAGERRLILADGGGLELVVTPTGVKSWYVRCRVRLDGGGPGPQRRVRLDKAYPTCGLAEARQKAAKIVSDARSGIDPLAMRAEKSLGTNAPRTVREAVLKYVEHLQHIGRKPVYWGERQRLLEKHLLTTPVAGLAPKHVTRSMLSAVLDAEARRQRKLGQRGILTRRLASAVTALWRFLEDRGWLEVRGTADRLLVSVEAEKPRDRILSQKELGEVFIALGLLDGKTFYDRRDDGSTRPADPGTVDALALALLLGLRGSEIVSLRTQDVVDGDDGVVLLRVGAQGAKTDAGRRDLPVPPLALSVLRRRQQQARAGRLFPSPAGKGSVTLTRRALSRQARRLAEELGHVDEEGRRWTPHDLRRTLASIMGELDVSEAIQKRVLGHAGDNVTSKVYDKSKRLRRMLDALTDAEDYARQAAQEVAGAAGAAVLPMRG